MRFRADSNRCRWCCRPLPSHSATTPCGSANLHQLSDRIKFYKRDVDNFCNDKYDLIISNPPYINKHKIKYLETINYEPKLALDGGLDGLEVIKKVISNSKYLLKTNGKLILEIGYDQKYKVINFLRENNFFINKKQWRPYYSFEKFPARSAIDCVERIL